MKTCLITGLGVLLFAIAGTPSGLSAQADHYSVYNSIYDEAGPNLTVYPPAATEHRTTEGHWYLLDFVKLSTDAEGRYQDCRQTWQSDHRLCSLADRPGEWHLFRVPDSNRAYDFVAVTPIAGEGHTFDQKKELPPELFTYVPPAVEVLLAQSTGFRELVWWTPCPRQARCRQLAANR